MSYQSEQRWSGEILFRTTAILRAGLRTARRAVCLSGCLLALVTTAAWAMPVAQDMATRGAVWLRLPDGGHVQAWSLDTDVRIRVTGPLAQVEVVQRFRNPGSDWGEGVYVFPLPADAAVTRFRLRVGQREIEGRLLPQEEARAHYEKGRSEGRRTALLEQDRPNVFSVALANLGPGEEITAVLSYQQRVDLRGGMYSLRFPLVVAPRYLPPAAGATATDTVRSLPPYSARAGEAPGMEVAPANPVRIEVDLDAGIEVAGIDSAYHGVTVERVAGHRHRVVLAEETVPAHRDFLLRWRPVLGPRPEPAVFRERVGDETYTLLVLYPPDLSAAGQQVPPRDLVFVVDVSASMAWKSLAQAQAALVMALERLGPEDRFNVIAFNDVVTTLFPDVRPVSTTTLTRALAFIGGLKAEGGTDMRPALAYALATQSPPQRLRQVIFLTDGAVGNEAELFGVIRQRLGRARLFTVGIGSAPNGYFMRRAAVMGRGTHTFIGDAGEVRDKVATLLARLSQPAFVDIAVHGAGAGAEILPRPVPDLYRGEVIALTLREDARTGGVAERLNIEGRFSETTWSMDVPLTSARPAQGIRIAWARARLASLMTRYHEAADPDERQRLRREIVTFSLNHGILSRFTSFVAMDVTPARAGAVLKTGGVPPLLPEGWTGTGVVLPQTATASRLHLMLGLSLALLALMLHGLRAGRCGGAG